MTPARPDRESLPEDPEELRRFFIERARERDMANNNWDSLSKTTGITKSPKEARNNGEPGRAPTRPDRGPRTTTKNKPKPYTIRYLTMEEVMARKRKTGDHAPVEQTSNEDRPREQAAEEPTCKEGKLRASEDEAPAATTGTTKGPNGPTPTEPSDQLAANEPDGQMGQPDGPEPGQTTGDTPVRQAPEEPATAMHGSKATVPEQPGPDGPEGHPERPEQVSTVVEPDSQPVQPDGHEQTQATGDTAEGQTARYGGETTVTEKTAADEPDIQADQPDQTGPGMTRVPDQTKPNQTATTESTREAINDRELSARAHVTTTHESEVQKDTETDGPGSQRKQPDTKEPGIPPQIHREPDTKEPEVPYLGHRKPDIEQPKVPHQGHGKPDAKVPETPRQRDEKRTPKNRRHHASRTRPRHMRPRFRKTRNERARQPTGIARHQETGDSTSGPRRTGHQGAGGTIPAARRTGRHGAAGTIPGAQSSGHQGIGDSTPEEREVGHHEAGGTISGPRQSTG